jgi:hypothetical protein
VGQVAEIIVANGRRVRLFAEKLLVGIDAAHFARKPRIGETLIETNHPAFVYGHLSLYPGRALKFLGVGGFEAGPPEHWESLFNPGTPCHDDPEGRIYPPMGEITGAYFRAYDTAFDLVAALPDSAFLPVTPEERFRALFPTVGAAVASMLGQHVSFHMGQLSAWRRCMGLGAVT